MVDPERLTVPLDALMASGWGVYCKPCPVHIRAVVPYLDHHTQRITFGEHRLLAFRHGPVALYQQARERNPRRWSGRSRDWSPVAEMTLNPERDEITASGSHDLGRTAA